MFGIYTVKYIFRHFHHLFIHICLDKSVMFFWFLLLDSLVESTQKQQKDDWKWLRVIIILRLSGIYTKVLFFPVTLSQSTRCPTPYLQNITGKCHYGNHITFCSSFCCTFIIRKCFLPFNPTKWDFLFGELNSTFLF